ncbi:unnamed protein product [Urochloa decumbens]|uniref:F-box domain-containing protein n=1 Tax=Urochloa decumbens TaxID=240449 RepID=A0ABC9GV11_9POAL
MSSAQALPDDLLIKILLRLPAHPSSLPCVSLVCKRWRRLVTDIHFIDSFHAHHRTPPLLGYFAFLGRFVPTQEPPCRTPPTLFSLNLLVGDKGLLDCRHGLVLSGATRFTESKFVVTEFTVFNPMTRDSGHTVISERQSGKLIAAAVVAAAGGTDRRSFRLIALFASYQEGGVTASVYSSDSGAWVNSAMGVVSPSHFAVIYHPSTLVGNAIYWMLRDGEILQFDLGRHNLAFIEQPPHAVVERHRRFIPGFCRWIIPAGDGHLGLAVLSEGSIQFWERETGLSSAATWELCKTVQLDRVLPLELKEHVSSLELIGFAEENNVIFISTHDGGVFMTNLESMQFKKVHTTSTTRYYIHPYSGF